jgi:hypothetical protein
MNVFDEGVRSDLEYADFGEGNYSFLNRTSIPEFVAAREQIEDWFSRYPLRAQSELAARMRDKNSIRSFDSAFFELFLHEFLTNRGCAVEVHPESNGSAKRPDFFVKTPGAHRFFLEAIVATGADQAERATETRIDDFYNAINRIDSPDFLVFTRHCNFKPATSIPVGKAKRRIEQWLSTLDYEAALAQSVCGSVAGLPTLSFEHDGARAELVAIPKKPEARGLANTRPVGGYTSDFFWPTTHEDIKSAIKKKQPSKYELGDLPYVVGVCCKAGHTRPRDIERALFGRRSNEQEGDLDVLMAADLEEGAWSGPAGPRNTTISGVLSVTSLHPWSVQATKLCLYHHPCAKRLLNSEELSLTDAVLTPQGVYYSSPRREHGS